MAFHQGETINGANFAYEYSYNQAGRVEGNRLLISNYADTPLSEIAQYAWDDHGRMTQMTYPSGPVMNYQFDGMSRTVGMTETMPGGALSLAAYATFGSASQLLTLGYGTNWTPFTESRTYNNMLQLTHLTVNGGVDMQYIYSAGHNNGRVTQTIDGALGETVNYTYDNLHRLLTADRDQQRLGRILQLRWLRQPHREDPDRGQRARVHGRPSATNATGPVDANGNSQTGQGIDSSAQWDVENRLVASQGVNSRDSLSYVYDPWGRRVWKLDYNAIQGTSTYEIYFRGIDGKVLETYTPGQAQPASTPTSLAACFRKRASTSRPTAWAASAPTATACRCRTSPGAKSGRRQPTAAPSSRDITATASGRITRMRAITAPQRVASGARTQLRLRRLTPRPRLPGTGMVT